MKVVLLAALAAAAAAFLVLLSFFRWDIEPMGGLRLGVYRLDRLTGTIEACFTEQLDAPFQCGPRDDWVPVDQAGKK